MRIRLPRYSKAEFAQRGDEIYERLIRPLEETERGKFAAIDVETGAYEIAEDELTACDRLEARVPEPQTWLVRIGQRYLHRLGFFWNGLQRRIPIEAADTDPLVGMSLLYGTDLSIRVVDGGRVQIEAIP